jgi:predicted nucleic acid-binding Zn ribbon protein
MLEWRNDMLPYAIVGAVGVLGFAGYKLGRKCSVCHERLKWTHNCMQCEKVICGSCGTEMKALNRGGVQLRAPGFACPDPCAFKAKRKDRDLIETYEIEQERLKQRRERLSKVRLISINYAGSQNPLLGVQIETSWHKEKYQAEAEAREIAVDSYDCDAVWYVNAISEKTEGLSQGGRKYYYRQWKIIGKV